MKKRTLGRSDLEVSALGLGCMDMRGEDGSFLGVCERPDYVRASYDVSLKQVNG